jgi:hypothetical protein
MRNCGRLPRFDRHKCRCFPIQPYSAILPVMNERFARPSGHADGQSMIDDELRARVKRVLMGDCRVDDFDRLFLDQRDRYHGKESFREIADFVAHRKERNKGLVTQTARDVFTSVDVWSLQMRQKRPSAADITRAAWANFRLASDQQLREGCKVSRGAAKRLLENGLRRMARAEPLTDRELNVVKYLGNRFIWKPAFTDDQLFDDFRTVLLKNRILGPDESEQLVKVKPVLALYAIVCMHGSSVQMDAVSGELLAGFSNKGRRLEVKVQLVFGDGPLPIMAPICMFLTSFQPEAVCEPALLEPVGDAQPHVWRRPLELNAAGKLAFIG